MNENVGTSTKYKYKFSRQFVFAMNLIIVLKQKC